MLKKLWDNRKQILEGLTNYVLIKEEVEKIASERNEICMSNICGSYDPLGEGCEVPLTQPCCSNLTGGCGCSLVLKTRSLSSECPKGYWPSLLTPDEETTIINDKIPIN